MDEMGRVWLRMIVSAAVVVVFGGWPAGFCFMSGCGPRLADEGGDPHRCCRAGLKAQTPGCCMSSDASSPATKAVGVPVLTPPTFVSHDKALFAPAAPGRLALLVSDPRDHSPPRPLVLRV